MPRRKGLSARACHDSEKGLCALFGLYPCRLVPSACSAHCPLPAAGLADQNTALTLLLSRDASVAEVVKRMPLSLVRLSLGLKQDFRKLRLLFTSQHGWPSHPPSPYLGCSWLASMIRESFANEAKVAGLIPGP